MREEILQAIQNELGGPKGVAEKFAANYKELMDSGSYISASRLLGQFLNYATEPEHKEPWQQ